MKNFNLLFIILLTSILMCFNCSKKNSETSFEIDNSKFKNKFTSNETVKLQILNPDKKLVDSIIYIANDVKLATKKGEVHFLFDLKNQKFGFQNLKFEVYSDGNKDPETVFSKFEIVSNIQPKLLNFEIVNTFPHDTTSFTQGLEFYKNVLYENTGLENKSKLLKTDFKTGKILKSVSMDSQYFGEGITIINNKIYQITWKNKTGFIYDAETLILQKKFDFDKDIQGWGMTNDGKKIYQSDGTEKIWTMNPETLKMESFINVYSAKTKIESLNELEWIDGKIYANIWTKDAIAIINPDSGAIESILNMAKLQKLLKNKNKDVLNGIAFNPASKTIFVTGKNWDKIFEIKVTN